MRLLLIIIFNFILKLVKGGIETIFAQNNLYIRSEVHDPLEELKGFEDR